jgi:hypothetical protein
MISSLGPLPNPLPKERGLSFVPKELLPLSSRRDACVPSMPWVVMVVLVPEARVVGCDVARARYDWLTPTRRACQG